MLTEKEKENKMIWYCSECKKIIDGIEERKETAFEIVVNVVCEHCNKFIGMFTYSKQYLKGEHYAKQSNEN